MAKWQQQRSFWTWGFVSDQPTDADRKRAALAVAERTGMAVEPPRIPKLEDIEVRAPRLSVPEGLRDWVTTDHEERLLHTHGGHPL